MSLAKNNLVCRCFLTDNYFVERFNQHVRFNGKEEFLAEHSKNLPSNCTDKELEEIVNELEEEQSRRRTNGCKSQERKFLIAKNYVPIHPHVYKLQEEFLSPKFKALVGLCETEDISISKLTPHLECMKDRVYRIPVFTSEFCRHLKEELLHFENSDLPKSRPNTMNHYGIVLEELLDFDEDVIKPLRERFLSLISKILYPEFVSASLDSHKAFVVTYRVGQDRDLDYHFDNAEVTCNISLDDSYEGSDLYFGGMKSDRRRESFSRCSHVLGCGVLHRGQHLHGATELEEGERQNLIIWMRSSGVRNSVCPMCGRRPSLVETDGRGDGFTMREVSVCSTS